MEASHETEYDATSQNGMALASGETGTGGPTWAAHARPRTLTPTHARPHVHMHARARLHARPRTCPRTRTWTADKAQRARWGGPSLTASEAGTIRHPYIKKRKTKTSRYTQHRL